ncbi:PH domain-containing protein [Galbitalea sp. SE-J8]|uniref:PH domain-containing protein n=1 Tax=Galbitalea sp. SE-J8 TaxID=3054952 RepID=UPI00259D23C0|nr:PH domain-containing protein [Galbitalea sp. SE-J8]MDM4763351.1 PH domain-containing protein [Galbitalea sp. SE-J8]
MERYTSRFNRGLAVSVWLLVGFGLVGYTVLHAGLAQPLWLLPAAFVAFAAWAWLWHPSVEVDDAGVTLVNLVRTVHVPWAGLVHVDTRFALTLITPRGRFAAWAAPAPGRTGVMLAKRREARASSARVPDLGTTVRPGDLLGSESGQAAALVRTRWSELRDADRIPIGVADENPPRIRVLWAQDAALLVLLAGTVLATTLV